jgi:hypothetical protein
MAKDDYLDDIHIRMLRVTEDLRVIQRELNCAAMQAPGDPELMEALSQLPEVRSVEMLKSALDQMRHFLWFYVQVITSGSEGEIRPGVGAVPSQSAAAASFMEKHKSMTDASMLQHYVDGKNRKPN